MDKNLEFFIELLKQPGSFNLWVRQNDRYYNVATLFYKNPVCKNQWCVGNLDRLDIAVFYNEQEIQDELESPLRKIQQIRGKELVAMKGKSPEEVTKYLTDLCKKSQIEGVKYLLEKGE